jgi:hypothetical protein
MRIWEFINKEKVLGCCIGSPWAMLYYFAEAPARLYDKIQDKHFRLRDLPWLLFNLLGKPALLILCAIYAAIGLVILPFVLMYLTAHLLYRAWMTPHPKLKTSSINIMVLVSSLEAIVLTNVSVSQNWKKMPSWRANQRQDK